MKRREMEGEKRKTDEMNGGRKISKKKGSKGRKGKEKEKKGRKGRKYKEVRRG